MCERLLCFAQIDNVQKQHDVQLERDGDEHQRDEPEDCCCQRTSLSLSLYEGHV